MKFQIPISGTDIPTTLPAELNNILTFGEYLSIVKMCNAIYIQRKYINLILFLIVIGFVATGVSFGEELLPPYISIVLLVASIAVALLGYLILYLIWKSKFNNQIKQLNLQYLVRDIKIVKENIKKRSESYLVLSIIHNEEIEAIEMNNISTNAIPQHNNNNNNIISVHNTQEQQLYIELQLQQQYPPPNEQISDLTSINSLNIDTRINCMHNEACDNISIDINDYNSGSSGEEYNKDFKIP